MDDTEPLSHRRDLLLRATLGHDRNESAQDVCPVVRIEQIEKGYRADPVPFGWGVFYHAAVVGTGPERSAAHVHCLQRADVLSWRHHYHSIEMPAAEHQAFAQAMERFAG